LVERRLLTKIFKGGIEMKRPFGITVIAIFALLSGLFGLCWPTLIFTGSAFLGPIFGTLGVLAGIFLIIGPLLQLIFAFGAFKLSSWAWVLGLISTGITVFGVVINLFDGASFWSAIWGSLVPVIIFIYLLTPKVRQAFGQAPQQSTPVAAPAPIQPPVSDDNTQQ
jgi:hypothetical protein